MTRLDTVPKPPAFVLNMYGTGLAIARNLGPHGVPVIGVSGSAHAPGGSTRYGRHAVGSDSETDPEGLMRLLLKLAADYPGPAVLFPTRDHDIFFIDRYREQLATKFRFAQPPGDALARIMDKERLAEFARSLGIANPKTRRIRNESDLDRINGDMTFPVVLKPALAVQWRRPGIWEAAGARKGVRVPDLATLRAAYRRIATYEPEAMVQEWVAGEEDQFYVYGAYCGRDGTPVAGFTARKLIQHPPEFGLGCLVMSVQNPEVEALGRKLLQALEFHGIAEVELKLDSRTGQYALIEINPRHWDQHELGTRCGVNLTYAAYRDLCGLAPVPFKPGHRTCYWIGGQGLWGAMKDDLRHGRARSFRLAFPSLLAPKVFSLWSWRDPRPAWQWTFRRKARG